MRYLCDWVTINAENVEFTGIQRLYLLQQPPN